MGAGLPLPIPLPWRNAAMTEGKPISLFSSIPLKLTKLLKYIWLLWYVFCKTWTEMLLQIQEEFAGRLWYKCAFATFDFATFDFLRLQPPSQEEWMTERKLIFLVPSKNPPLCVVLHNLCTNYKGGIFPLRNASLTAMGLIFLGHCQRIPLSLYLSIFWLRSLLRETIVTVMEVSFLDHHSLQPAVYISYSIFLSPIFDDGNVVTFHDPS